MSQGLPGRALHVLQALRSLGIRVAVLLFLLSPFGAAQAQCVNAATPSCSVYPACFAKYCPCAGDTDEYFMSYGAKYCQRFLDNVAFSPSGKKWRDATLVCLQEAIVPKLKIVDKPTCDCKAMRTLAFDSHVACYTQPKASICDLPMADVAAIAKIVDAKDLFTIDGGRQMAAVGAICASKAADDGRRKAWAAIKATLDLQK